jgi:Uma2 family endonuclease
MSAPVSSTPLTPAAAEPVPPDAERAQLAAELEQLNQLLTAEDRTHRETGWHHLATHVLVSSLNWQLRSRDDFYVGANTHLYFSADQVKSQEVRGPDFYYVSGVPRQPLRPWWCAWQEKGRLPDLIIELVSPKTAADDYGPKMDIYEHLRVGEYFCYDPDGIKLQGWRLNSRHRYQPLEADPRGWLWSEELQLWLGPWEGNFERYHAVWLRFYEPDGNVVLTTAEAQVEEVARLRAMLEVHARSTGP